MPEAIARSPHSSACAISDTHPAAACGLRRCSRLCPQTGLERRLVHNPATSVRERRTQQGKPFRDATARNATGGLPLKIWGEVLEGREDLRPGLWGITGKLESFQDRSQFVVSEYRPITIEQYREHLSFADAPAGNFGIGLLRL